MKKLKLTIKVEATNIRVEDGYYYFDYVYWRNGKKRTGTYDGDFDSQSSKQFKQVLEKGYALDLVIELFN